MAAIELELRTVTDTEARLNWGHSWILMTRGIIIFALSSFASIDDLSTITEVTLRIYSKDKSDTAGLTPDIAVYQANTSEQDDFSHVDYGNVEDEPWSDAISYASFPSSGWVDFVLNETGVNAFKYHLLVGDSYMAFALRNANYDAANLEPTWSANALAYLEWATTETDGATYAPRLVVNVGDEPYEPPPTPPTPIYTLSEACDIHDLVLEISEREIYNDVRAECDLAEILELRPDATPDAFTSYEITKACYCPADSCTVHDFEAPAGQLYVAWIDAWISSIVMDSLTGLTQEQCEAIEAGTQWQGQYQDGICYLPPRRLNFRLLLQGQMGEVGSHLYAQIYNKYTSYNATVFVTAQYVALEPEKQDVKLRGLGEISTRKYGRRVMNLVWPLGITPLMMQSLIDDYIERYAEPVVFIRLTLVGKDDTIISRILDTHIDDAITLVNSELELNHDFWVNQVTISHRHDGLLEGVFQLEQVRS